MTAVYFLVALLCVLLNAFFVLAEFAAVSVRRTRLDQLAAQGSARARLARDVKIRLDEYLSVCQVGITFASIGLGFVGEQGLAAVLEPALGSAVGGHALAATAAYLLVSFVHIFIGELVPKSIAIRKVEAAALGTAALLRFFRLVFLVPIMLLNAATNLVLRALRLPLALEEQYPGARELKLVLSGTQRRGKLSFRRLLIMENVLDLGNLPVKAAMHPRSECAVLDASQPWEQSLRVIRSTRFSRYPVVRGDSARPLGIVHVKEILHTLQPGGAVDLEKLAHSYDTVQEDSSLEELLATLQHGRRLFVLVVDDHGGWTGFLTMEDVLEEIVGSVEDEFEGEPNIYLQDAVRGDAIVLGLEAENWERAIREAIARSPLHELGVAPSAVEHALLGGRGGARGYLGQGVAMPSARIPGLDRPLLIFARSRDGIPVGPTEKVDLIFIVLAPAAAPGIRSRLVARLARLLESELFLERLRDADSHEAVLDALHATPAVVS